ncbi:MAG: GNAT family N-acetyltransferase [Clostridiaceae bacterium]|nr:GNAT family N-acetyltransferase [Clostridiaceae bacterium]
MEKITVLMICDRLEKGKLKVLAERHPLPAGYYIRKYRIGEEGIWAEIETAAGEFKTEKEALDYFEKEFGPYRHEMEERCFFVIHKDSGRAIGTTTAWYNDNYKGQNHGRIHWVEIHPDFQGRKLAKPLLATAMIYLAEHHDRAYLVSHTTRYKAINMYLDFGFKPELENNESVRAWKMVEEILERKILD